MNRDLALTGADRWAVASPGGSITPHGDPDSPAGMDAHRLLRILRERKLLILSATIIGFLLATAVTMMMTAQYRARIVLQVNPPSVQVMEDKQDSAGPGVDAWQFVATQVGLLQSNALAQQVAKDLGLEMNPKFADQSDDPAKRVEEAGKLISDHILVAPQADGELIRFSYESESPVMAAKIANAYADAFISSTLQRRYEASAYARRFLEGQITRTRAELEKSERLLVQYAQAQGIIDTSKGDGEGGDGSSPQGQSLVALNEALAQATARRVAAEGAYRQAVATGPTTEVTDSTLALRQSLAALQGQYQQQLAIMKPDHPTMVSLRSQISELQRQISSATSTAKTGRVNSALADYRGALSAEQALEAKVTSLKSDVLNLRGRSIRYAILQRDVDTNRALYDALLQRYKEIGVAGGIGASPISIVDRADVPEAPFTPNLFLNVILGLSLGLLSGIISAIGLDILNDTIKTPSDVRTKLRLACLGAIPKRVGNSRRTALLAELDDPASPAAESYATIATSLRFTTDEGLPRALLVTSAKAGEGKSSSALAISHHFAKLGKKVLLIDADLRKPSFVGDDRRKGLSRVLTTDEALSENIAMTKYKGLCLLPCGPEPPNPAALLGGHRFRTIIAEACAEFDLVVVDSPPLLGLADTPLIASVVRAVLLVVESGGTRTAAALEAIHRLSAAGANILGVALTKSSSKHGGYGYGYGYGYGDRYGYVKGRYAV